MTSPDILTMQYPDQAQLETLQELNCISRYAGKTGLEALVDFKIIDETAETSDD